jgi:transposase
MDVHKKSVVVCLLLIDEQTGEERKLRRSFGTTTRALLELAVWLKQWGVETVAMESTGVYWKPVWNVLEEELGADCKLMLVNARHAKNLPGRKSDVSDAAWLAQLGAHGLVRASFVPPEPIRQLRDLTRTRTAVVRERGREIQRLEKLLEDAGIKLSSVATDITGVSGRAMLAALIEGQRDPAALADLARRRLRSKIPALTEALTGRFSDHHAFLARLHLDLIDQHTRAVEDLTARIEVVIEPFRAARELLVSIPGVSTTVADVIIAETGADMTRFPTAAHLASWAGTCPGSNESAGRVKSTHTRPGNPYLKGALGIAAMSAARAKNTYLAAKYRRIAARRGPLKALVAVERAILTTTWHMITTGALYDDPGSDFYTRRNPDQAKQRALDQLHRLGYTVTIEPHGAAVGT